MAMVCSGCGAYVTPRVDKVQHTLCCPKCSAVESVRILPLFIVTGASGVGKTTVVSELRRVLPDFDVFETDVMWDSEWPRQRSNWLRVAYSVAQSGRGTVLCGTMMPEDIKQCDHYALFKHVYFLNLHCDDVTREARLRARPAWRNSGTDEFIAEHQKFAQWLIDNADTAFNPPMPTVDTTHASVREVVGEIQQWIQQYWQ